MTKTPRQIWLIELSIPKTFLQWRSDKIREIINEFVKQIEALSISDYHIYGNVEPQIKVRHYLKRG